MLEFTVHLSAIRITTSATDSDAAVHQVLEAEGAPFEAFRAVYQDNPVPAADSRYGAPLGRRSASLDHDGLWEAVALDLDEGGYDDGGVYWGLRMGRTRLYAVQDGMGNIAYVDAICSDEALSVAARREAA